MQSSHQLSNNQGSLMGLSQGKSFLRPQQSTPNLTLVAWKKRGPPRVLGWTKSQVLDSLMATNARICATFCLAFFPLCGYMAYRYQTVKKNVREYEKKKREELLAEGAFEKS